MPKVFIVVQDYSIQRMYINRGWKIAQHPDESDFIQFTGGADVSPMLYGEPKHPRTGNDPRRDDIESGIYNKYVGDKKLLGICRGGQFLNVMNGGSMYQDVDNHAIGGTHAATIVATGQVVQVTSTHHQMMLAGGDATTLVIANLSSYKEDGNENNIKGLYEGHDNEVLLYKNTMSLCFQPHPEYVNTDHECQNLYFNLIKQYMMN